MKLENIRRALDKLSDKSEPGEIVRENRTKHDWFFYRYKSRLVFSFGITRASRREGKSFYYIHRQMSLSKKEFEDLVNCQMTKKDYNNLMIEKKNIDNNQT